MVSHRNSFEEVTRTYSAGTRFLQMIIFTQIWLHNYSYRVIIHTDVREIVKVSHRIHTFQETNQTRIQSPYCKWLPNQGTKQPMGNCSETKCHAGGEHVTSTERRNPKTLTQGTSGGKQTNPIGPRVPRWEGNIGRG